MPHVYAVSICTMYQYADRYVVVKFIYRCSSNANAVNIVHCNMQFNTHGKCNYEQHCYVGPVSFFFFLRNKLKRKFFLSFGRFV